MPHDVVGVGLYVIFGVILLPVYAMIAGWFFGNPMEFRPVGVAAGYLVLLSVVIVLGLWIVGILTGFVMTY